MISLLSYFLWVATAMTLFVLIMAVLILAADYLFPGHHTGHGHWRWSKKHR